MSYSFSVRGSSVRDVLAKALEELNKVVDGNPEHHHVRGPTLSAVEAFAGLLPVNPDNPQDISVVVNGSVTGDPTTFSAVSVGVSASLVAPGS